jgi:hypothetical protein
MLKPKFLIIFILTSTLFVYSQEKKEYELHAGFAFYETVNAGVKYVFPDNKQKVGISLGFDNFTRKDETYFAITLEHNLAVFRKKIRNEYLYKWFIDSKVIYWRLKDEFYNWDVISFSPSLQRSFYFSDHLSLTLDAGPSFNIVLHNKRKTFREIGWPYHVMPDIRVLLSYRF